MQRHHKTTAGDNLLNQNDTMLSFSWNLWKIGLWFELCVVPPERISNTTVQVAWFVLLLCIFFACWALSQHAVICGIAWVQKSCEQIEGCVSNVFVNHLSGLLKREILCMLVLGWFSFFVKGCLSCSCSKSWGALVAHPTPTQTKKKRTHIEPDNHTKQIVNQGLGVFPMTTQNGMTDSLQAEWHVLSPANTHFSRVVYSQSALRARGVTEVQRQTGNEQRSLALAHICIP